MNERVAHLWADALDSGEYRQGTGRLRKMDDGESYCCLGVLCELHRRETKNGEWVHCLDDSWNYRDSSGCWSGEQLTPLVREWAGLHTDSPEIPAAIPSEADEDDRSVAELITELNDSWGWEFERFAISIRDKFRSM